MNCVIFKFELIIKLGLSLNILLVIHSIHSFVPIVSLNFISFQGAWNSFGQFNPWIVDYNSSLSFQFQTKQSTSIIFYADNPSLKSFIQLKLLDGRARFRFKIKSNHGIVSIGSNLHDNRWHWAEISQTEQEIFFKIDDENKSITFKSIEPVGDRSYYAYDVFIGGLPEYYLNYLNMLSLPWSFLEPHYKGQINSLVYSTVKGDHPIEQKLIKSKGIRYIDYDFCSEHDTCLHGGTCINTDNGTFCDCKYLDFEGDFCENEKQPEEATLHGQEFITLKSNLMPIIMNNFELSLYFKTRHSHGLLFYIADKNQDYLNLALKDGSVTLFIKLGTELMETIVKPSKIRFDDNQWHKVIVHQKIKEISRITNFCYFSITVDGMYLERGSITGDFSYFSIFNMYIGGSDQFETLPGLRMESNFIGCLRKVEYSADSLILDVFDLVNINNGLMEAKGNLSDTCQELEAADPITFTTSDSFLTLPKWEANKSGSLSFKIRTNEPHGLIMFNNGASNGFGLNHDYFGIEIIDGHVYLLLNLGSVPIKIKASNKRIDDADWHVVTLIKASQSGQVSVDHNSVDFIVPGPSSNLDLEGLLYLGGLSSMSNQKQVTNLPPDLWTGSLKYGFIGCLRDLVINNKIINLDSYLSDQDSSAVRPSCHSSLLHCDTKPCLNNGLCNEGWNHFTCDCSSTNFMGPICAQDATTLSFNGDQFMRIDLVQESVTQADNLNIRFRTIRSNGLILITTSDIKPLHHLLINLEFGRLKVTFSLDESKKVSYIGHSLNDDQWHTLKIEKRGPSLDLKLDKEKLSTHLIGQVVNFHISSIHLGAYANYWNKVIISHQFAKNVPNFVGFLQNIILNQDDLIELSQKNLIYNFTATAKYDKKNRILYRPFTFKSINTYLGLPSLKAYSNLNLNFQFKTKLSNGLILFNSGKGGHFIAIELVSGNLHYVYNAGDGPRRMKSNARYTLNDNQWHSVAIGRPNLNQHTLTVDDMLTTVTNNELDSYLDLESILYLGGVPQEFYHNLPSLIHSKNGFEGCLASFDLNGQIFDLSANDVIIKSTLVTVGCEGNEPLCSTDCINCSPSIECKCNTPFPTSADCLEDPVAYKFGYKGGLITFKFTDQQIDTKTDQLSVSFVTKSDDAILVRVDSGNSNDYMELQIVDGFIQMIYNLGTEDHIIGELNVKVNDGYYHHVRFMRWGPNSTLQLDNHNLITKVPSGRRQLTIFNSHSLVQIGGKFKAYQNRIERPFQGVIKNVIFNDYKILELAAKSDARVKIEKDAVLFDLLNHNQSNLFEIPKQIKNLSLDETKNYIEPFFNDTKFDEREFSGDGSGCCWDDEDYGINEENGSANSMITSLLESTSSSTSYPSEIENKIDLVIPSTLCEGNDCLKTSTSETKVTFKTLISTTTTSSSIWTEWTYSVYDYETTSLNLPATTTLKPFLYTPRAQLVTTLPKPPKPIRPTGIPLMVSIPLPHKPVIEKVDSKIKPKLLEANSVNKTAMFIALIAIILIAIVILAPIILFIRVKFKRISNLEIENSKHFNNFLSGLSIRNTHSSAYLNGNVTRLDQAKRIKDTKKEVKEWYV